MRKTLLIAVLCGVIGWCAGELLWRAAGGPTLIADLEAQARTNFPSTAVLTNATATGASAAQRPATGTRTFHVYGATTAGAGAATVVIEVSNISPPGTGNEDWVTAGTVTLTLGTTRTGDGFVLDAPWTHVRARVTAISGTGAAVNVRMGN